MLLIGLLRDTIGGIIMSEKEPLVSIIIPVYNGSDYVAKAIDSALAQTYSNLEILVVNDGSKDDGRTEKIVLSYDNKVQYLKKENGGVSSALNLGLNAMNGEYFSWLSHDDEYAPTKIASQVELLLKHQNEKLVALCGTSFIDKDSKLLSKKWIMPEDGVYSPEEALKSIIHKSMSGISFLIPKSVFEECGFFDETLRYTQDKNMWRRIFLQEYGLVVDSTLLAKSRLHGAQQTNLHRERFVKEMEQTEREFCQQLLRKGYSKLISEEWYQLLKNNLLSTASNVFSLMRSQMKIPIKVRIKGALYFSYGCIRPIIRKIYYFLRFGIVTKKQK